MTDANSTPENAPTAPGLTFKTQLMAVDRLTALGYKVGKSKFNDDFKSDKIARGPEGFEDWALKEYARRMQLPLLAAAAHSGQVNSTAKEKDATARLKDIQAARQELKFQKEQGLLMPKAQHEAELSARALFFRAELEGFGPRAMAGLIHLVGGREDSLQDAMLFWAEQIADLMNAWAEDREFAAGDDDEQPEADEFGGELGDMTGEVE